MRMFVISVILVCAIFCSIIFFLYQRWKVKSEPNLCKGDEISKVYKFQLTRHLDKRHSEEETIYETTEQVFPCMECSERMKHTKCILSNLMR